MRARLGTTAQAKLEERVKSLEESVRTKEASLS